MIPKSKPTFIDGHKIFTRQHENFWIAEIEKATSSDSFVRYYIEAPSQTMLTQLIGLVLHTKEKN